MSNTPLILLIDGNHQDREYYTDLLRASPSHFVVLHVGNAHFPEAITNPEAA